MEEGFRGKLRLAGFLATLTGVAIGKDKTGTNNTSIPRMVVRHPITAFPYIPASSFRGALRRVLTREFYPEGKPAEEEHKDAISQIFGVPGPGKATFRDLCLTRESIEALLAQNHESYLTEINIYASMDRVTSQGNSYAIEKIPAGSHFQFEIFYSIFQSADLGHFMSLLQGLQSLEMFSMGSYGSRGLGQIRFGKWIPESFYTDSPQLEGGLSLKWYGRKYYEDGTGEVCLVKLEDNYLIEDVLRQKDRIASAIH